MAKNKGTRIISETDCSEEATKIHSIFDIPVQQAKKWCLGDETLEGILNLSPSEDSAISHFLIPLLKKALGYNATEIDIKPELHINYGRKVEKLGGQSDVVVKYGKTPAFVIEAKSYGHPLKSKTENAEGQAFDYTRANELKPTPPYYITTNVTETHIYETSGRKEVEFSPILERELLTKLDKLGELLGKKKFKVAITSPSAQVVFRRSIVDQREFEAILFKCQDDMREAKESRTGISAFNEMNKLLFIKLFEDRRERRGQENRFTLAKIVEEGENYIKGTLFNDIKTHYKQRGIGIFKAIDEIVLDSNTINRIVKRLETICLVDEEGRVYPPVAHVYENFVSTIFRGENGQYFTPRKIVDFMVKLVQVQWSKDGKKIADPACGSGGFLLSAFAALDEELKGEFMKKQNGKRVFKDDKAEKAYEVAKTKLCEDLLVGFDNEDIVAKTATMNMSVHGDGSTGIYFGNSLAKEETKHALKPDTFDFILTNPPFSANVAPGGIKDVDGRDILSKYELSHKHCYVKDGKKFVYEMLDEQIRGQDSKILFLERSCEILKSGGIMGIIVDDGVLNNPSNDYVRDFIYRNFVILAIVALPFDIFKEQDAHNYTSILFLQKKTEGMIQEDVFMAITEHAGENYGKSTIIEHNDLDDVLEDYFKYKSGKTTGLSRFSFVCKRKNLEDYYDEGREEYRNRLDPKYYSPRRRLIEKIIEETGLAKAISDVVEFAEEKCPEDQINAFGSKYIDKITKSGIIEYAVMDGVNDPKGKKDIIFRKGDLVASRINLKSGMIGIVPDELNDVRATSEYYKPVPKNRPDGDPLILRKYLFVVLTSEPIQYLMHSLSTGQYGRLHEEELGMIRIPVPDSLNKQQELVDEYEAGVADLKTLKEEYGSRENGLRQRIQAILKLTPNNSSG